MQLALHVGCLLHGNYRKPARLAFHLHGIMRAITQLI
jgi:hypothetical protein